MIVFLFLFFFSYLQMYSKCWEVAVELIAETLVWKLFPEALRLKTVRSRAVLYRTVQLITSRVVTREIIEYIIRELSAFGKRSRNLLSDAAA